jgi:hypothetical protein
MPGQQREPHQEKEQIGKDHSLVLHVRRQAGKPRSRRKGREGELVGDDRGQASERHRQGVVMK